jgi:hypothetical protein
MALYERSLAEQHRADLLAAVVDGPEPDLSATSKEL